MPTRKAILVADDSENDRILLKRALESANIDARMMFVSDGREAIDYLSGHGAFADRARNPIPRLLVLDLKMPKTDGFDVLRWLQSEPGLKRLPVTVLTSSDQSSDINKAYDLGANSYVVKPCGFDHYIEFVNRIHQYWMELNRPPDCLSC